jgi:hypothetical protein
MEGVSGSIPLPPTTDFTIVPTISLLTGKFTGKLLTSCSRLDFRP